MVYVRYKHMEYNKTTKAYYKTIRNGCVNIKNLV